MKIVNHITTITEAEADRIVEEVRDLTGDRSVYGIYDHLMVGGRTCFGIVTDHLSIAGNAIGRATGLTWDEHLPLKPHHDMGGKDLVVIACVAVVRD